VSKAPARAGAEATQKSVAAVTGRRTVRPFIFPRLERIPRVQLDLMRRLEWMLPDGLLTGEIGEGIKQGMRRVFDEDVVIWLDYVHAVPPNALRKIMGDPTFLGVIAPTPHGARGLVELDLVLAHSIIDLLLGAPGESAVARPLTEIEQGVLSWVLLETFKAFSPSAVEPGRHRLRLERLIDSLDEGMELFATESMVAVVELKILIGAAVSGYLRLHLPESVIKDAVPPENSAYRRGRRLLRIQTNLKRLAGIRVPLRVEIGRVELTGRDIKALRPGDVMLVDELTTKANKGENGRARLRIGAGRAGWIEAAIELVNGRYQAKIESVVLGDEPPKVSSATAEPPQPAPPTAAQAPAPKQPAGEHEISSDTAITDLSEHVRAPRGRGWEAERTTVNKPEDALKADAAELLNDVPLQVVVELARIPVTAEELVSLHVGKILDLGHAPGEPVDLSVNGRIVARGELVEVEGQLGVRLVGMSE
jgi:flagellar motor switch protein FliM